MKEGFALSNAEREAVARYRVKQRIVNKNDKQYRKWLEAKVKQKLATLAIIRVRNPDSGIVVDVEYGVLTLARVYYRKRLVFKLPGMKEPDKHGWMVSAKGELINYGPNYWNGERAYGRDRLQDTPTDVLERILKVPLPE